MNKKYIIKKNTEIERIIKTAKKFVSKNFVIYYEKNNVHQNMYCISVNKKIGKAYNRNFIKRRIKDILSKNKLNFNKNYVIITRKGVKDLSYNEIQDEILYIIKEKIR